MGLRLSKNRRHLYFPIDWTKPVNSRAFCYAISKWHQVFETQILAMFPKLPRKIHTHKYVNSRGNSVEWDVWYFPLTEKQILKYLEKYYPTYSIEQIREESS